MKREIKFRAWNGTRMGNVCVLNLGNLVSFVGSASNSFIADDIMQFTSYKDINGKEIYEGDILLCHEYDSSDLGSKIIQTFKNAVVGFEKGSFYYYPKGNMKQPHQLLMYAYKPEIIGNIYENPELLNA